MGYDANGNWVPDDQASSDQPAQDAPPPIQADQSPPGDQPSPDQSAAPPPISGYDPNAGFNTISGYDPNAGTFSDPNVQAATSAPPPVDSGSSGATSTASAPPPSAPGLPPPATSGPDYTSQFADMKKQLQALAATHGGGAGMWSEADFAAYMNYLNQQAAVSGQRYTQSFGLEQSKFDWQKQFQQKDLDLRTAIANATQTYQQALIQTRNVELAQTAARDSMTRDFQLQELAFKREQNASQLNVEREKLDLQRRLLPAARTTRRAATVTTI